MMKVAIIDKQRSSRKALEKALLEMPTHNFCVTLESACLNSKSLLAAINPHVFPDIALVEMEENGLEKVAKFYEAYPDIKMIVYSSVASYDLVRKAFQAGAQSYLLKDTFLDDLEASISCTLKGWSFISPSITKSVILHSNADFEQAFGLSARERQVIDEVLDGLSYKLIGYKHNLSIDTVRQYIKRAYKKLNINSKGQLMAMVK